MSGIIELDRYIAAWNFCAGTDAGGRGGGAPPEPARHRARRPLRNPLNRRRGAAQLAHHRLSLVRCRGRRLRRLGDLHDRQRRRHARDLTRLRLVAALRGGGACWPATRLRLGDGARGGALGILLGVGASGSRGMILKTASALIAVSTGAAAGGVSGALARLLNSSTPTVVTSAAGTS